MFNFDELKRLEWDSTFWNVNFYDVIDESKIDYSKLVSPYILQRKVNITDIEEIQLLESNGFLKIEQKLTLRKDVDKNNETSNTNIRLVSLEDIKCLTEEIGSMFVKNSRYRFLEHQRVKRFYYQWVENSCLKIMDPNIDGYFVENKLAGFISYRIIENTLIIGLFGVLNQHQGKGIASALLKYINQIANELELEHIQVSTQASNKPAVNVYMKNGYKTINEEIWYYKMKLDQGEQK